MAFPIRRPASKPHETMQRVGRILYEEPHVDTEQYVEGSAFAEHDLESGCFEGPVYTRGFFSAFVAFPTHTFASLSHSFEWATRVKSMSSVCRYAMSLTRNFAVCSCL